MGISTAAMKPLSQPKVPSSPPRLRTTLIMKLPAALWAMNMSTVPSNSRQKRGLARANSVRVAPLFRSRTARLSGAALWKRRKVRYCSTVSSSPAQGMIRAEVSFTAKPTSTETTT